MSPCLSQFCGCSLTISFSEVAAAIALSDAFVSKSLLHQYFKGPPTVQLPPDKPEPVPHVEVQKSTQLTPGIQTGPSGFRRMHRNVPPPAKQVQASPVSKPICRAHHVCLAPHTAQWQGWSCAAYSSPPPPLLFSPNALHERLGRSFLSPLTFTLLR